MKHMARLKFALIYAGRHIQLSALVAIASLAFVFFLLYPAPYHTMLGVGSVFFLLLAVDVVCGPLLTLILANPKKSRRERWMDFSLIGVVQIMALAYGLHSLWLGRPSILAFEYDRLLIVTANEIEQETVADNKIGLRHLPWYGVVSVALDRPKTADEVFRRVDLGLSGISPAMLPPWWLPWDSAKPAMNQRAKPVAELLARRPQDAATLQAAIQETGLPPEQLRYLPLTSSRTKEWVALLDGELNMVGWAPVDGFAAP